MSDYQSTFVHPKTSERLRAVWKDPQSDWVTHYAVGAQIIPRDPGTFIMWTACGSADIPANAAWLVEGDTDNVNCTACQQELGLISPDTPMKATATGAPITRAVSGYCPKCAAAGVWREGGRDRCENDHIYPSRAALDSREGFQSLTEQQADQGSDPALLKIGEAPPYGYCPECGAAGLRRERRPNGNDTCANDCVYPSSAAVADRDEAKNGASPVTDASIQKLRDEIEAQDVVDDTADAVMIVTAALERGRGVSISDKFTAENIVNALTEAGHLKPGSS